MTNRWWEKTLWIFGIVVLFGGCAPTTQVTTTLNESDSADGPYRNILVIALLGSFDSRRYLETEVIKQLATHGADATASTSMMNTKTPVTQATFVAMVEKIGADAVLLTQITDMSTGGTVKSMRPERTVNIRPTYYFNVYSVETTEYLEPPSVQFEYDFNLATELFSVEMREAVWAIDSSSDFVMKHDQIQDYSIFVNESEAIVNRLAGDGLLPEG